MKIKTIVNSAMDANTYLVYDEASLRGFLVDPGSDTEKIDAAIMHIGVKAEAVLITHGHFDHALSAKRYHDAGIPVYIHSLDADKLNSRYNLGKYLGYKFPMFEADRLLSDGDALNIAGLDITVIHTPGHSKGGACYYLPAQEAVFTGDTLFEGDIGRADFYDGDPMELRASIENKLFLLPEDTVVYPGHDITTAIGKEKANQGLFL